MIISDADYITAGYIKAGTNKRQKTTRIDYSGKG